jgi:hypothetical protein
MNPAILLINCKDGKLLSINKTQTAVLETTVSYLKLHQQNGNADGENILVNPKHIIQCIKGKDIVTLTLGTALTVSSSKSAGIKKTRKVEYERIKDSVSTEQYQTEDLNSFVIQWKLLSGIVSAAFYRCDELVFVIGANGFVKLKSSMGSSNNGGGGGQDVAVSLTRAQIKSMSEDYYGKEFCISLKELKAYLGISDNLGNLSIYYTDGAVIFETEKSRLITVALDKEQLQEQLQQQNTGGLRTNVEAFSVGRNSRKRSINESVDDIDFGYDDDFGLDDDANDDENIPGTPQKMELLF